MAVVAGPRRSWLRATYIVSSCTESCAVLFVAVVKTLASLVVKTLQLPSRTEEELVMIRDDTMTGGGKVLWALSATSTAK